MIVLMTASAAFLTVQIDPPSRVGRLNYMEGPVSFQPGGINKWRRNISLRAVVFIIRGWILNVRKKGQLAYQCPRCNYSTA